MLCVIGLIGIGISCRQERLIPALPTAQTEPKLALTAGNANFERLVMIGDGWMAGMQNGTLYNQSQAHSLAAIIYSGLGDLVSKPILQPHINSTYGYLPEFSNPEQDIFKGYLYLTLTGIANWDSNAESFPAPPSINPAFDYHNPATLQDPLNHPLNNLSAPELHLQHLLDPQVSDWSLHGQENSVLNLYYARIASNPGQVSVIDEALRYQPTFFLLWIGMDQVLAHAINGGTNTPLMTIAEFRTHLEQVLERLNTQANVRGLIGDIVPVLRTLPFFSFITFDQALTSPSNAELLNAHYEPHNTQLLSLHNQGQISTDEYNLRRIHFEPSFASPNRFVIHDATLSDLSAHNIAPIRHANAQDIIMLSTGDFLYDPTIPIKEKQGFGTPMGNEFVLIPQEITTIETHIQAYNTAIMEITNRYPNISPVLISERLEYLSQQSPLQEDGVGIGAQFLPLPLPIDMYSLDGIHPNSRGYAFVAKAWLAAIEDTQQAVLRHPKLGDYPSNVLPTQ